MLVCDIMQCVYDAAKLFWILRGYHASSKRKMEYQQARYYIEDYFQSYTLFLLLYLIYIRPSLFPTITHFVQ